MHKILYKITAQLPCRLIDVDCSPYMERYAMPKWLRTALKRIGFTVYLHRFVSADSEQRVTGLDIEKGWISKLQTIRWFNRLGGLDFHCITKPKPNTWTLFIHGPRTKSWGFLEAIDTGTIYTMTSPPHSIGNLTARQASIFAASRAN